MSATAKLTATLEDYLEAIFRLAGEKGAARVQDIAGSLSVHKSSVTSALRSLSEKDLVEYVPYQATTLTPAGRKVAERIARRHEVLRRFLSEVLSVQADVAEGNACRMEHAIDPQVLDRLVHFIEFVQGCPRAGAKWIRGFRHFCDHGFARDRCERCMELCLREFRDTPQAPEQEGGAQAMVTLDQLRPGQKGKIVRTGSAGGVTRRLAEMGAVRGTAVEVIKVAPLGDPIEIKIKGYNLSLRKAEAAVITVEPE